MKTGAVTITNHVTTNPYHAIASRSPLDAMKSMAAKKHGVSKMTAAMLQAFREISQRRPTGSAKATASEAIIKPTGRSISSDRTHTA